LTEYTEILNKINKKYGKSFPNSFACVKGVALCPYTTLPFPQTGSLPSSGKQLSQQSGFTPMQGQLGSGQDIYLNLYLKTAVVFF